MSWAMPITSLSFSLVQKPDLNCFTIGTSQRPEHNGCLKFKLRPLALTAHS